MRLPIFARRAPVFIALLAGLVSAGCNNNTATDPTPTLTTDTFTGTIGLLGSSTKTFTVNYALSASDGSITLTSLVTSANSTPIATTLGIGIGSIAFDGSCSLAPAYTANAAAVGQELVASGAFPYNGTYCVEVFDSGTLTEPAIYTIAVKHY